MDWKYNNYPPGVAGGESQITGRKPPFKKHRKVRSDKGTHVGKTLEEIERKVEGK
jgi:hypothetical protein